MIRTARGETKITPEVASVGSSVMMPAVFNTAGTGVVKVITSTNTFAIYVGKAPKGFTTATLRCRVNTAWATITWAEIAIAKGEVMPGGNPVLTVVGFKDVSASHNSTGQKSDAITLSAGQSVNEGDDLWVLFGGQATTAAQYLAMSIADDLQVGVQASAVVRPSLTVGTGVLYTLEGATTTSVWCALVV